VTRLSRSLRLGAMLACAIALTACAYGSAHKVPGSDMALPASVTDQFLLGLVRQCEVSRIPSSVSDNAKRETCSARSDTSAGQTGAVARPGVRVP